VKYDNEMKVEFLSKSCNESLARVIAAAFVAQLDPTVEELAEVKTAVSEAVTNAIIHGYEDQIGIITMECKLTGDTVIISVTDKGKGIHDIKQAMEPLFTTKPHLERSGLGFTVMQAFMDELDVQSEYGKGTCVTMKKKIKSISRMEAPQE